MAIARSFRELSVYLLARKGAQRKDGLDCEYLSSAEYQELNNLYCSIGAMLARMIDRADDFCKYAPSTNYRSIGTRVEEESSRFNDSLLSEFFHQSPFTTH